MLCRSGAVRTLHLCRCTVQTAAVDLLCSVWADAAARPRVCVKTKPRWSSGLYIMHDVLGQSVGSWSGLSLSAVVIQNRQSSQWSGRCAALNGFSSSSCKPATTLLPHCLRHNQYQKKHHIKRKTHKPRHSSASPVNPHLCGCKASLSSCLNIFKSLGSLSACCWGAVHSTKL